MHQRLKERLVGAAVLVVIAVIFIPMLLTGPVDSGAITKSNIPDKPTEKFKSKLVPLNDTLNSIENSESDKTDELISDIEPITEGVEKDAMEEINDKLSIETDTNKGSVNKAAEQKKSIKDKQVGLTAWVVQLGSFESKVNADKLNLSLRKSGFPAFVEPLTKNGETSYRVRVGPE
ncbi:MAG: SPOR domain-containing protein, partial [Pseudomonadota bacterium]